MAENERDSKARHRLGEPVAALPDLLRVIPKKIPAPFPTEEETDVEYFRRIAERRQAFSESVAFYVLDKIDSQAKALRAGGHSDREINSALRGLLDGQKRLGLGQGLHPDSRTSDFTLANGLVAAKATKRNVSVAWIARELRGMKKKNEHLVKPSLEELQFFYRNSQSPLLNIQDPSKLMEPGFFRNVSFEFKPSVPYAERVAYVANATHTLGSMGFDVTGPYKHYDNDCLDYVALVLAKAVGVEVPRRDASATFFGKLENGLIDGMEKIAYAYPETPGGSVGREKILAGLGKSGVAVMKIDSWFTPGQTHWTVIVQEKGGASVYGYEGKHGLNKMTLDEFFGKLKANRCAILQAGFPREIASQNYAGVIDLNRKGPPASITI